MNGELQARVGRLADLVLRNALQRILHIADEGSEIHNQALIAFEANELLNLKEEPKAVDHPFLATRAQLVLEALPLVLRDIHVRFNWRSRKKGGIVPKQFRNVNGINALRQYMLDNNMITVTKEPGKAEVWARKEG